MSESCSSNCSSCASKCSSAKPSREDFLEPANANSNVKKIIGVVSGKGGVGKSFITSYMSVLLNRKGYNTAILDADVTGPSIPKAFGVHERVSATELGILPAVSKKGTKIMSVNLILDSEETPVIWRGPVIAGTVKQFWSEVMWEDVDYMFVDMPPGTGDVPLTVFQSLPLDGIIIVTSPQELVSMIVSKAVNMAKAMDVPILGLVENYSYLACGNCGEKISVFGESHVEEVAAKYGLKVLAKMPIDPTVAKAIDAGEVEELDGKWLDEAVTYLEGKHPIKKKNVEDTSNKNIQNAKTQKIAVATDGNNNIDQHFGHCKQFMLYEFKDNQLVQKTTIMNSGEGHEETAKLLQEQKVNVVICGGIGSAALNILLKSGITVIPGMLGDIDVLVSGYLDGGLLNGEMPTATCNKHEEEGHSCCGECSCH